MRHRLHSTDIELIADAHYHLIAEGRTVNAPSAAESDLSDVVSENDDDDVPTAVRKAHELVTRDEVTEADMYEAADLLDDFLRGTDYDPTDPDSHHPNNQ